MEGSRDFIFDKRIIARHVTSGVLEQEQVDTHLADLPDLAEQVVEVSIDLVHTEIRIASPAPAPEDAPPAPAPTEDETE